MISSANIQRKIIDYLSDQERHSVQEIKAFLRQSETGDYTEGQFAGSINTLLRNGTIYKIDRGIYALKTRSENMKKCFVVSPIGGDGTEIRSNADKLFKHIIKPVCENCGFDAERVDQLCDADSITQTIVNKLESADLVIADMTGHNPNVFYEMGYRARTKKPMIHLKRKGDTLPFDVNTIRTLEYDLTDLDSVEEVKERLKKTIESFSFSDVAETPDEDAPQDNASSAIIPILYQLLDMVTEIKADVKNFPNDTISTIVRSMQPAQPQISPDAAMQMQLMNGFMQNPEAFMRMVEFADKYNTKGKK